MSYFKCMNQIDEQYEDLEPWHAFIVCNILIDAWMVSMYINEDDYDRLRAYNREMFNVKEDPDYDL